MDLYSRRIIGWSMSRRINRHLVLNALSMALGHRQVQNDLIHHSDRGVQYLSDDFQALLKKHGITCSMSDKGSCYDNAVAPCVRIDVASFYKPKLGAKECFT